jgi:hypothetical protein
MSATGDGLTEPNINFSFPKGEEKANEFLPVYYIRTVTLME